MDASDFEFIESQLDAVLPNVFKDFMRGFPHDASHQLQNDCDVLPANGELFVIAQLRRFNNDRDFDYYELQPDLRHRRFMDIGGDGCGNFYCMVGNDSSSNELWTWEHDPYDGLTRCDGGTLTTYFGSQWKLTACDDPFATTPADGTVISRADHPHRSPFKPITMQEWQDYVASDPHLELDEDHAATDPFTNETIMMRRWPGRARLTLNDSTAHITYSYGSLMLSSPSSAAPVHKAAMQVIAQELHADVF